MKIWQIKELAEAVAKDDSFSDKGLQWIFSNFSRAELKLFNRLLALEIKNNSVVVTYAGNMSDDNKNKIERMFSNKKILFKRDDEAIGGGASIEYGDFVLDYSVSGIIKRILSGIRDGL
jgi:F0F1-type ATP synthase delta subunit